MNELIKGLVSTAVVLSIFVAICGAIALFAPEEPAAPLVYPNGPQPLSVEEFTKLQEDLRKQGHGKKVGVQVLDFYADWCKPCRAAKPAVKKLIADGYDVREIDIDTEAGWALKQSHGVQFIPTFIVMIDGHENLRTQDVQLLAERLAPLKPPR